MTTGIVPGPLPGSRLVNGLGVPLPEFGRWLDWLKRFSVDANSGQLGGTQTNDAPLPGNVGELLTVTTGPLALTSGVPLTIAALAETPGDFMLYGAIDFLPAATTNLTRLQASISTATNSIQTANPDQYGASSSPAFVPGANDILLHVGFLHVRVPVGGVTRFLVAQADFTVSTMGATARLNALRIR